MPPRGENRSLDDVIDLEDGLLVCIIEIADDTMPDGLATGGFNVEPGATITRVTLSIDNESPGTVRLPTDQVRFTAMDHDEDYVQFPVSELSSPIPDALLVGETFTGNFFFSNPPDQRGDVLVSYGSAWFWENPDRTGR